MGVEWLSSVATELTAPIHCEFVPVWEHQQIGIRTCACVCVSVCPSPTSKLQGALLLPPSPKLECAKVGLHSLMFHLALISFGQGCSTLGESSGLIWYIRRQDDGPLGHHGLRHYRSNRERNTATQFLVCGVAVGLHKWLHELWFSIWLNQEDETQGIRYWAWFPNYKITKKYTAYFICLFQYNCGE